VLDEKAYEKLSRWIVLGFPTSATPNMMDTVSMRLLQRFSASLLFAEYPSAADAPPDLDIFWRKVELSFKVLRDLETKSKGSRTSKPVSPISRRETIDPRHFDSMEISMPVTDTEVREAHARVLSELQSILEVCGCVNDTRT
jgi:hypothetical protein